MLTFVRGLPGSGKSTKAKTIAAKEKAIHLETDMFWGEPYSFDYRHLDLAHEWCRMSVAKALYNGHRVVVANTFVNRQEFLPYLRLAVRFERAIDLVECTGQYNNIHNVPEHAIDRMKRKWEAIDLHTLVEIYEHIKYGELF